MSRLGSFLSLPPPPLPLVLFSPRPGIWPRTYLSPAPSLAFPSPLSSSCGWGGRFCSWIKGKKKKNELSVCGRRLACRLLAYSTSSSVPSWCVWPSAIAGLLWPHVLGVLDHFEAKGNLSIT